LLQDVRCRFKMSDTSLRNWTISTSSVPGPNRWSGASVRGRLSTPMQPPSVAHHSSVCQVSSNERTDKPANIEVDNCNLPVRTPSAHQQDGRVQRLLYPGLDSWKDGMEKIKMVVERLKKDSRVNADPCEGSPDQPSFPNTWTPEENRLGASWDPHQNRKSIFQTPSRPSQNYL